MSQFSVTAPAMDASGQLTRRLHSGIQERGKNPLPPPSKNTPPLAQPPKTNLRSENRVGDIPRARKASGNPE
jgi:hypothetical protein